MKKSKKELKETRQFKRAMESDLCHIQFDLRLGVKYGLNITENAVYQIIKRFTQLKYGGYTGSVQTLQVFLNSSYNPITNALVALEKRGFVDKTVDNNGRVIYKDKHVNENYYNQLDAYKKKLKAKSTTTYDVMSTPPAPKSKHFKNERNYTNEELNKLTEYFEEFQA